MTLATDEGKIVVRVNRFVFNTASWKSDASFNKERGAETIDFSLEKD